VGYSGSKSQEPNPTYKHILDYAESIRIQFDPDKISYEQILDMFFHFHTPVPWQTTQYRSAIFYHTPEQEKLARETMEGWSSMSKHVTLEPGSDFYRAEEYHQNYMENSFGGMRLYE